MNKIKLGKLWRLYMFANSVVLRHKEVMMFNCVIVQVVLHRSKQSIFKCLCKIKIRLKLLTVLNHD